MNKDSKYVIVDLNDGTKCEGILINIDKEKMEIILGGAKKYRMENNVIKDETKYEQLTIPKIQIKEVKMVQTEDSVSPSTSPNTTTQTVPQTKSDTKTTETTETVNPNAIPKNLEKAKQIKHYEKNNFFDSLNTITNQDSKAETIRYNEKNFETFNITESSSDYRQNNYNNNNRRGGRGGGHRGRGNYNNNRNNYNNNNNYENNNYRGGNRGGK